MQTNHIDAAWVQPRLPRRLPDSNKGTYGRVLVIGGSENYIGAPALAALAAYRAGAGLVTLCVPAVVKPIAAQLCPEATFLPFEVSEVAALRSVQAVVLGPGMGQSKAASQFHRAYLSAPLDAPHLIDADALNLLAPLDAHKAQLPAQTIITPHPGEMSRLTERTTKDVQADRVGIATRSAAAWGCVVLLKGAGTIVAAPNAESNGTPAQLAFANPAMAVAGMGDVLSGVIGGLLAQGLTPFDAAVCGAFLHGAAGDRWRQTNGDAGLLASDLLVYLPRVLHEIQAKKMSDI